MNVRTRPRRGRVAASLAALALLGACSSETRSGPGSETSTTVAEDTTTTTGEEATTTTTVAPMTTPLVEPTSPPTAPPSTAPVPACDAAAPSGSAASLETASGDWNGDGIADSAISWVEPGTMDWYVRMEVAGGAASTVQLQGVGAGFAAVLGAVDVDFGLGLEPGENHDELLAIVGVNSAGYNLGVFGVGADGCAFQFDDGAGHAYEIPIHGAAAVMSGMRCEGAAGSQFVVELQAEATGVHSWDTHDTKVERTGPTTLERGITIDGTMTDTDPQFAQYAQAECFGTDLVGGSSDY